jgi:hypothetical protein
MALNALLYALESKMTLPHRASLQRSVLGCLEGLRRRCQVDAAPVLHESPLFEGKARVFVRHSPFAILHCSFILLAAFITHMARSCHAKGLRRHGSPGTSRRTIYCTTRFRKHLTREVIHFEKGYRAALCRFHLSSRLARQEEF